MKNKKPDRIDIKVTKKRLSGLLFYDWLILVAIIAAIILVWELIFGLTSVRLTTGQRFYYYYDVGVANNGDAKLRNLLSKEDEKALSFSIVELNREIIDSNVDVLNTRLQVQDGDIVFCSNAPKDGAENRANWLVIAGYAYNFNLLIQNAQDYVNRFTDDNGNIMDAKVRSIFMSRIEGGLSNKYRTDAQREIGVKLEKARIEKLIGDVADLKFIMENHPEILYKNPAKNDYYGIDVGKLVGDTSKTNVTEYVTLAGTAKADGVILMPLNFLRYQPHEQFEVIGFMMAIVKDCSNILD